MKRSIAVLSLVAGVLSCSPTVQQVEFKYAEKRAVLENGLRLVIIPDKNTPMVQVNVRYEVGSNEDPPGKRGLAHFVEHMMFQHRFTGPDGPPTFEMLPVLSPGGYNAYTDWEKTHYYLTARAEDVEGLIRLEAGRLAAGCKFIPEAEFAREREVVRNEIRQRTGGPDGQSLKLMLQAAYPDNHAYREYVGGDDQQLSNITFKDVCDFLDTYYSPDRATVVVIGNVDVVGGVDAIGKMIKQNFGGIAKKPPAKRKVVEQLAPFPKRETIEHRLASERSTVNVIWRMPPEFGNEATAMNILASNMNARLNRFREDWNFGSSVSAGLFGAGGHSGPVYAPIFIVTVELYKYEDLDKALGYVWKAAAGADQGVTGEGFDERSKNISKASALMALESLGGRADYVSNLIQFEKDFDFTSEREYLFADLQKIDDMKTSKFRSFVKGRLSKNNARVVVFRADKDGIKGDTRSALKYTAKSHERESDKVLDVAEASRPLPVPSAKSLLGQATSYTLGNGMKVILLPIEGSMPVVTATLLFRAGSAHESPEDSGLANLAARFRGPPRDSDFWTTGIRFGGGSDSDATYFQSRGISIYLDVMVKGVERIVRAGYVSQDQIESWQKRAKDRLKSERALQQQAFGTEFRAAMFGKDHPYTTTGRPTKKSIGRMGRDRLNGFARKHFSAGNATLVIAGGFELEKAKSVIDDAFGSWSKGHVDKPIETKVPERSGPVTFGVATATHPQVTLLIGYPGPAGIDDKYAARLVLSRMVGMRMARVRSELGSTYGVGAGWRASVGPSAYVISGSIDKARAAESLTFMRNKLKELREGKGFQKDFAEARRAELKRLLAESSESGTLADRLSDAALFDLSVDVNDKLVKQVAGLKMEAVKQLIDTELNPNQEVVGALGDKEGLEKMFSEAGINDVRFIEPQQ